MINENRDDLNIAFYVSLDMIDIFIFYSLSSGLSKMSSGAHFELFCSFVFFLIRVITLLCFSVSIALISLFSLLS